MPAQATKLLVGFIVLLLAATVIWPIPFSHVIPTLIIIIISFVYLEEDGVLLYVALLASLLLFGVTAATVWAILD
jgi:hypothetical protein